MPVAVTEKRFAAAMQEWEQYESWKKNRNPDRAAMEAKFGYDAKHASHLIRLLRMATEILEHGRTGLLFSPKDAEALARAVLQLVKSPGLRERLGRAAACEVREKWLWCQVVERMRRAESAGRSAAEGLTIACEIAAEVRPIVRGIQISASADALETVLGVMKAAAA